VALRGEIVVDNVASSRAPFSRRLRPSVGQLRTVRLIPLRYWLPRRRVLIA